MDVVRATIDNPERLRLLRAITMKLRIHRSFRVWHYSDADEPTGKPMPTSTGYATHAEATRAAIAHACTSHTSIEALTGHADKTLAKELAIPFEDERGNHRRGTLAKERQRARFDAKAAFARGQISAEERDRRLLAIETDLARRRAEKWGPQ